MNGRSNVGERAIIALGANLDSSAGTPADTVQAACRRLTEISSAPVVVSALYETSPLDCPAGSAPFINAVAIIEPPAGMTAISLLDALQALEQAFGRERSGGINAPRTLDLDLVAFKDVQMTSARLLLPHPRAHERQFVLAPLAELEPDLHLPGHSCSVSKQLQALPGQGMLRRLP